MVIFRKAIFKDIKLLFIGSKYGALGRALNCRELSGDLDIILGKDNHNDECFERRSLGEVQRGVGKRHDLEAVRWYVLTLPTTGVARRDRISPAKSLDAELSRRGVVGRRCSSISPPPMWR